MPPLDIAEEVAQLRRMRTASIVEGVTLVVLLGIAVPLKHLLGFSIATAVMGPIHGLAFVFYFWTLIQTVSGGDFTKFETTGMIAGAFVPLGGFINERMLARRQTSLRSQFREI